MAVVLAVLEQRDDVLKKLAYEVVTAAPAPADGLALDGAHHGYEGPHRIQAG